MNSIKILILSAACAIALPAAAQQQLYPIAQLSSSYSLALDTTPAPAGFIAWCPTCAGHMLIGAQHDALVLSRAGGGRAAIGGAWAYAPNTTGTLASGGAVVATVGVTIGSAARAGLQQLPAAADAVGYSSSTLTALSCAVEVEGYGGPRIGGANGIPKVPYGVAATLSVKWSYAAVAAIFGK